MRIAGRSVHTALTWAALTPALATGCASPPQDDPFTLRWQEVAPGVHVGSRPVSTREPVVGTTVVVLGEKGVLLWDAGGFPLQGTRVVDKVRSLTDLPVTDIVISHWHGDHNLGLAPVQEAFPNARLIAQTFTVAALQSPLMDYIKPGQEEGLGSTKEVLQGLLDLGVTPGGDSLPSYLRGYYQQLFDDADVIDAQLRTVSIPQPTFQVDSVLELDLGGRSVEVRHLGRANTRGDLVLLIPDARVVATGDIVVRPTPYGFHSYPREWARVLRELTKQPFDLLIPGHGELLRGTAYLDLLAETMVLVADQVDSLVSTGLDLQGVRDGVDFSTVEERFTGGDPFLANRFRAWFTTPIVEAAFTLSNGGDPEPLGPGTR